MPLLSTSRLAVVLIAALLSTTAAAAPATYKIDRAKTKVFLIMLKAPGGGTSFSHDHLLHAPDVSGEIVWDAANPKASRMNVAMKAATLQVDDPKDRERFGLQGVPSETDVAALQADLTSDTFLNADRYPEIRFASTSAKQEEGGRLVLVGNLTMGGKTRPVEIPVSVTLSHGQISGVGRLVVKQTDFGMTPCNRYLGAVKCGNELVVSLVLVGRR